MLGPAIIVAATLLTPLERVVAVLDEGVVCLSEVRARARLHVRRIEEAKRRPPSEAELLELHKQVVAQIIDERIIEDQARTLHLEVTNDEIDRGIETVTMAGKISRQELLDELARVGMTEREYRDEIRRQILDAKWVGATIRVTTTDETKRFAAIEEARVKELARIRKRHYVEIRL